MTGGSVNRKGCGRRVAAVDPRAACGVHRKKVGAVDLQFHEVPDVAGGLVDGERYRTGGVGAHADGPVVVHQHHVLGVALQPHDVLRHACRGVDGECVGPRVARIHLDIAIGLHRKSRGGAIFGLEQRRAGRSRARHNERRGAPVDHGDGKRTIVADLKTGVAVFADFQQFARAGLVYVQRRARPHAGADAELAGHVVACACDFVGVSRAGRQVGELTAVADEISRLHVAAGADVGTGRNTPHRRNGEFVCRVGHEAHEVCRLAGRGRNQNWLGARVVGVERNAAIVADSEPGDTTGLQPQQVACAGVVAKNQCRGTRPHVGAHGEGATAGKPRRIYLASVAHPQGVCAVHLQAQQVGRLPGRLVHQNGRVGGGVGGNAECARVVEDNPIDAAPCPLGHVGGLASRRGDVEGHRA